MENPEILEGYNFAYLDDQTKRMIRRAILKAVAIPGYQVPFGSREMPLPFGWGTGGIQVTASIIGQDDILKVIDQGSDDTTNAVNIRNFFGKTAGVDTTEKTISIAFHFIDTVLVVSHKSGHPIVVFLWVRFEFFRRFLRIFVRFLCP